MICGVRGLRDADCTCGAHSRELSSQSAGARAVGCDAGGGGRDGSSPLHSAWCGLRLRPVTTALSGPDGVDRDGLCCECRVGEAPVLQECPPLTRLLYSITLCTATLRFTRRLLIMPPKTAYGGQRASPVRFWAQWRNKTGPACRGRSRSHCTKLSCTASIDVSLAPQGVS